MSNNLILYIYVKYTFLYKKYYKITFVLVFYFNVLKNKTTMEIY